MNQIETDQTDHLHVECYINWPDGTWNAEHYVTVPADAEDDAVESNAIAILEAKLNASGVETAAIGIYHWRDEVCAGGPECRDFDSDDGQGNVEVNV